MLSEQYSDRLYSASPLAQQSVEVVQQWVEVASNSAGRVALEAQGACTVLRTNRGIPPGGEALLDGAGVHGALDDGVVSGGARGAPPPLAAVMGCNKEHLGPIEPAKWAPIIMIHGLRKCGPCAC